MTDTPSSTTTAKAASFVERYVTGRFNAPGAEGGFKGAASKSWGEVKNIIGKEATLGQRTVGFARVGAVGVGSAIALGAFKGKDAEGNDRSALARLGQAVVGTGMIAGGVLAGGR